MLGCVSLALPVPGESIAPALDAELSSHASDSPPPTTATPDASKAEDACSDQSERRWLGHCQRSDAEEYRVTIPSTARGTRAERKRSDGVVRRAADHQGLVIAGRGENSGRPIIGGTACQARQHFESVGDVEVRCRCDTCKRQGGSRSGRAVDAQDEPVHLDRRAECDRQRLCLTE